jgi:signal transduction histidine kinase
MFGRARLRLAAWYAGALFAVLAIVGGGAYLVLRQELNRQVNDALDAAVAGLSGAPPPAAGDPRRDDDANHEARESAGFAGLASDVFAIWLDPGGAVIANPRQIDLEGFPLARLASTAAGGARREDIRVSGEQYRLAAIAYAGHDGQQSGVLVVGKSLAARDGPLRAFAIVMGAGGMLGIALAALGGFWIAGRALVPIQDALETQRRFVSDASHELRTPIAVVRANAEVLLRHPDQSVEANIDQVAAISDESEHMSRLVGELLTLARADEQRLGLVVGPVLLHELLDTLVRDMGALAERRGITLRSDFRQAELQGDSQRIRQVAAILIDNALKYTPAAGTVTVRCRRDGHRAELSVSDTGPGIPAADQPHIFDRFYRSDRARTGDGGTGLGLAIAQSIVEAHGGRITLESSPGRGTTFTVRLPTRPRSAPAVAAP